MLYDANSGNPLGELPNGDWVNVYQRVRSQNPALIEAVEHDVKRHIERQRSARFDSREMGGIILPRLSNGKEWETRFPGGRNPESNAVFGVIVWRVFYQDERRWHVLQQGENISDNKERRHYFL